MRNLKGPEWSFVLFLFSSIIVGTFSLSIDESLKPKENFITIHRDVHLHEATSSHEHHVRKREIITHDNITAKVEKLNDSHQQLFVHWTGNKSNVFICLARNYWDHLLTDKPPTPSAVYISYDSGTTYVNKTNLFTLDSNSSYASIDKYFNHIRNQNYMVFIDTFNKVIFVSKDYGETIKKIKTAFQPIDILFYPENPLIFLAYDVNKTLWITRDFGASFSIAQEFVKSYSWTDRWPGTWTDTPTRSLLVQRIEPYAASHGSTLIHVENIVKSDEYKISVKMRNIEEFKKLDDFVFVTKKITATHYDLYISYRGGDFYKAIFDDEHKNNNFHVVDVSEVRIMVAVAHNETLSNLYISEVVPNSDYMFRLSLERLFCYFPDKTWKSSWLTDVTEDTFADLHKVKGLRGIYLASQVTKSAKSENLNPEHLQTLITFDWGGEWKPITPPNVNEYGQPIIDFNSSYSLHLTQKFMYLYPFAKTIPILTSESAPGLIVATGVLGTSLKGQTSVFVSRDAGLTWKKVLRGDYTYSFGDHGGILTAAKLYKSNETQDLLYSTDEGESWKTFKFIDENIKVYNLMTERGENTTVFTLFGSAVKKHGWIIINVDLKNAFKYNCTDEDYKTWFPSGGSKEKKTKPVCVMGLKEVYERRILHSNCYSGRDNVRPIRKEPCSCDIEDFECDFGFTRHVHSSGCIHNKSINYDPYKIPDTCMPGAFYNRTKGYRKIDGDACYKGLEWQYLPDTIPCPFNETSHFLLVALKKKILRFNLAESSPKPEVLPVKGLSNVIAIDFDMKDNCLYYGDVERDIIARQCLSGKKPPEILVESGLKSVEGIAYDWISKMLYFVDGTTIRIEAIRTDISYSNRMRITILNNGTLDKPRGIALHPVAGYLYWTDWSKLKPHVGRANLNGSGVQYLFTSPDVHWPNGITVDHFAELIYWVDARLDYIAAADLHGRHFRKIIRSDTEKRLSHPFSVAVFKDLMYWDDWEQKRIFFADKDHGVSMQTLTSAIEGLMDIKVFAHGVQEGTNVCSNSSRVCSHLCFAQPDKLPPVCACPDDMIMKDGECRCFDGSKPFSNHTCPKIKQCLTSQFQCADNNSCIPLAWKCNGENDCEDNSDEMDCSFQTCTSEEHRCKNGYCIPKYWVCDGDKDCSDGDDELNCSQKTCKKEQFRCNNAFCIPQKWVCDGENDCRDHSDELNCTKPTPKTLNCTEKQHLCSGDQVCIPESWVCDGVPDCKDHSDEDKCPVPKECDISQFQCEKSKRCIYKMWLCDGDYDCGQGDMSDEANCTHIEAHTEKPDIFSPCKEFMFKCADNRCIPEWWKCDGVSDCVDNSDEIGCSNTEKPTTSKPSIKPHVKCKANEFSCGGFDQCIPSSWTCDGNKDCSDGSDEANCKNVTSECPPGHLKCHFSNSCYQSSKACDGHFDCPDHSDERDCANKSPDTVPTKDQCPVGYFKCPEATCIPLSKVCDTRSDCYDGFDETHCEHFERVYQVNEVTADLRHLNATSLPLSWSIDKPADVKLEFLPSIAAVSDQPPQKWTNQSKWIEGQSFTFGNLQPYTQYNVTIYVRIAGKERIFPPSLYSVHTTGEDLPSPPWNLTVIQKSGDIVEVKWTKPTRPNGVIKQYMVYSTPPLPPMRTLVLPQQTSVQHTLVSTIFQPGAQYSFWVVAENTAGVSNSSEVFKLVSEEANIGMVKGVHLLCNGDKPCLMTWKDAEGASGYRIQVSTNMPYPKFRPIMVNKTNSYSFTNFAPGVMYRISINGFHKTFEGQMFITTTTKEGFELPVIQGIALAAQRKSSGYAVTLNWKPAVSDHYKDSWTYGIYYGISASELLDGPRNKTTGLNATIENLEACETYLFDIGVVAPRGYGPLSGQPARFTTGYHKKAPPKGLELSVDPTNETLMIISWNSSCFEMKEPIGYRINIEDTTKGKQASVTLLPRNSTSLQHKIKIHYGARYKVNVQTNEPGSLKSPSVECWAPLLPVPSQVKVERYRNNTSYLITWELQSNLQSLPKHHFEILLHEGEEFNESQAIKYKAATPPFHINEIKPLTPYSVAVRLVSEYEYYSPLSEINNIRLLLPETSMKVVNEEGGAVVTVASVFLIVSVGVFTILLGLILGVYIVKHHRYRNSFATLGNSHYSTSSDAAIFTGTLVDDDSPVIRGFSDDEPLVVA